MFWNKKSKTNPDDTATTSSALVRQDPRTRVETTTAQSQTTNTSVQNATIFNSNTNTVTYQTTRQTVTHEQQARITEIISRRTPTPQELEEMLAKLNVNKPEMPTAGARSRKSGNFNLPAITSGSKTNGISTKSTPKFKSTSNTSPVTRLIFNYDSPNAASSGGKRNSYNSSTTMPPATPTLVKIQQTTVTQKDGRTVTSHTEQQRIKIDSMSYKLSSPNSPLTTNNFNRGTSASSSTSSNTSSSPFRRTAFDAKPLAITAAPTATRTPLSTSTTSTYVSPYIKNSTYTPPQPNTRTYAKVPTTTVSGTTTFTTKPSYTAPKSTGTSSVYSSSSMPSYAKPKSTFNAPKTTTTSPFSREFSDAKPSSNNSSISSAASRITVPPSINTGAIRKKSPLKPGYAYIFNNERFDNTKNEFRTGSSEDVKVLRKTFDVFKLKVSVIENGTLDKIANTVQKIETKDYTNHSCLVIVILSHGSRYEEIAAKDGNYSIDDKILYPILRNRTLIDKPKIFIIQACKGSMEIGGFHKDAVQPHGSPNEILKCYSTFEGYVSYRTEEGSIFIQALCECLNKYGSTKNIKDLMETVTLIVKMQSQSKQIPSITSTLTKPYIFGDYS